jgi:hypothetical protein
MRYSLGPQPGGSLSQSAMRGCSSMAELQLPKLITWVRFPSPAPTPILFCHAGENQHPVFLFSLYLLSSFARGSPLFLYLPGLHFHISAMVPPFPAGPFSLLVQRKETKRKDTPMSWPAASFVRARRDGSRSQGIPAVSRARQNVLFCRPCSSPFLSMT